MKEYIRPEIPHVWRSLINNSTYPYKEYSNIETPQRGCLPLPKEGYPYTIDYIKNN